jgi:hypothetical protein
MLGPLVSTSFVEALRPPVEQRDRTDEGWLRLWGDTAPGLDVLEVLDGGKMPIELWRIGEWPQVLSTREIGGRVGRLRSHSAPCTDQSSGTRLIAASAHDATRATQHWRSSIDEEVITSLWKVTANTAHSIYPLLMSGKGAGGEASGAPPLSTPFLPPTPVNVGELPRTYRRLNGPF